MTTLISVASLLSLSVSTLVSAQSLTRSEVSREFWPDLIQAFEPRLVSLGDHNGDGVGEILLGDYSFRYPDMMESWGKVSVLDGATGEERWGVLGERDESHATNDNLGFSVTEIGDRDGDGIHDILAGCLIGPARILSGTDGSELYRSSGRVEEVGALGDVDQDGVADFALRRSLSPWGAMDVHSGRSLALLYTVRPPFLSHLFGYSIVSIGDVDSDQVPDFAVGAPENVWFPIRESCNDTYVFVYSGRTGQLLYHIPRPGVTECEAFGYALAAPGDLNGDEVGDLVIGLPDVGYVATPFPRVFFHDGKTGERFAEVGPPPGQRAFFSRVLISVGDSNGNGFPDLLVSNVVPDSRGLTLYNRGEVWLLDGGTREFLYRIRGDPTVGPTYPGNFSLAMTGLGDLDGDDFPEFLIGTPGLNTFLGRLDWFSGAPQGIRSLGEPCSHIPGVTPRIGASGVPRIGKDYELHLSRVEAGQKAFLAVGFPVSLGPMGRILARAGGRQTCGPAVLSAKLSPAVAVRTAGNEAAATVRIPIVNDPSLVGRVLLAQWILVGARGTASTRVLEITIQNAEPTRDG